MSDDPQRTSNTPPFWVHTNPEGIARVHTVACAYFIVAYGQDRIKTKDGGSGWLPFKDYASARAFAERLRDKTWSHLSVDCRRCKPGST